MATRRFHKKHKKRTQKNHKKPRLVVYGKIYANWCGHCRAMEQDWKRLEKRMHPLKSVNIESEEKDHKIAAFNKKHQTNLELKGGFPTVFKLPKKGGAVEYYEGGDRSEAALHAWLNETGGSDPMQNQNQNKNNSFLANLF